jgi:hypothetical protein
MMLNTVTGMPRLCLRPSGQPFATGGRVAGWRRRDDPADAVEVLLALGCRSASISSRARAFHRTSRFPARPAGTWNTPAGVRTMGSMGRLAGQAQRPWPRPIRWSAQPRTVHDEV